MAKNVEININVDENTYEVLYPKVDLTNSINNLDWDRINKKWTIYKGTRQGTDTIVTSYTLNYPAMLPVFFIYAESDILGDSDLFSWAADVSLNGGKHVASWNFTMERMIIFNHYLTQTGSENSQNYIAHYNSPYGANIYPYLKVTFSWTTTSLTIGITAALGAWETIVPVLEGYDIGNGYRTTYNFLVGGFSLT